MDTFGVFSLIPVLVIIVFAVITRDTFISLVVGVAVGFLMVSSGNPVDAFNGLLDGLYTVMAESNTAWVLMLCGLFGSLIMLMRESGGVLGFSRLAQKYLKTRKSSVVGAWILGIIVFVDDYLNCLAVGAAVRDITDKHRVSREMLAYIINSTGVTVCAIIPFSTWSAFMGAQMETADMTGGLSVTSAYIHTVPFVIYGWLAVLLVPFFATGILPVFGPMKKAEQRALETGKVLSEESSAALVDLPDEEKKFEGKKCRALNFLLPILLVCILTISADDILVGLFAAIALCFVMYIPQRLMSVKRFFGCIMDGLVDMFPTLVIIILSYTLIEVNGQLGLIDFVVGVALKTVSPALLPVTVFVVIGLLSFASGSFWGLAAIAFPIVGPLAAALDANLFLCAGALISAVCFGGHICMYSDTVILTSASTQSTNAEYFRTAAPLVAVPFAASIVIFLALGILM
ncbi:Na+/H+ antiporter NhaC family protein [Bacilliculturomica massiliensis]|uniref:Na+/H+ antiporter NhaC family protein n=1 Tax=Bacilliculturomica massiliensis TaxID=1917867 RepID=UPI0013EF4D86|nr:Na+/H+ antiporter NhaC family protein [Bacilliculturomica massiliensis]